MNRQYTAHRSVGSFPFCAGLGLYSPKLAPRSLSFSALQQQVAFEAKRQHEETRLSTVLQRASLNFFVVKTETTHYQLLR